MIILLCGGARAQVNQTSPIDLRFTDLPLCFENTVARHYILDDPPVCTGLSADNTTSFLGDVFAPPPSQQLVKAVACALKRESISLTKWFFQSETKQDHVIKYTPISRAECLQWHRQQTSRLGRLERVNQGTTVFSTRNRLKTYFSWPKTNYFSVENAIMQETSISFNTFTGVAQHMVDPILSCDTKEGYCTSEQFIYTFQPLNLTCLDSHTPLKLNTTILFHKSPHSSFFRSLQSI